MRAGTKTTALLLYFACSAAVLGPYLLPATQLSLHSYDTITDGYLFMWNFWWIKQALFECQNPYWTELLNHPFGTSLVFHTLPLTYGVLSVPFQIFVSGAAGLVVAMNVVSFASFVLAAWGAYLLAHHVTRSHLGSLIAGLLFSFTQFHFLNSTNLHKAAIEVLPFFVLACLRLSDKPSNMRALALAASLAVAFYTSMEFALHLVVWAALWLAWTVGSRDLNRALAARLAVAALLFGVVALPLLVPQARALLSDDSPRVEKFEELAGRHNPALLSLVTPSRTHRLWGDALQRAGIGEYGSDRSVRGFRSENSLSQILLLLAVVSLLSVRRTERWFWAVLGGLFLVLALGPNLRLTGSWNTAIPLPYALLAEVLPPLRVSRDPTRFLPIAVLMFSVLAAFGVRDLLDRVADSKRRSAVALAIGVVIVLEFWPQSFSKLSAETNSGLGSIREAVGDFAVLDLRPEPYRLLAQTVHGHPIMNIQQSVPRSESGQHMTLVERAFRDPAGFLKPDVPGAAARIASVRQDLRTNQIRFIVVPLRQPEGRRARGQLELARRLGAQIDRSEGIAICDLADGRAS